MTTPILPVASLKPLRAALEASMRHTARIYQPTTARRPGGSTVATWALLDTGKCDARALGTVADRVQGGIVEAPARYVIKFPIARAASVQPEYRLAIDAPDDDGRPRTITARIIGDVDGKTGRVIRQVIAEAIPEWRGTR